MGGKTIFGPGKEDKKHDFRLLKNQETEGEKHIILLLSDSTPGGFVVLYCIETGESESAQRNGASREAVYPPEVSTVIRSDSESDLSLIHI